MVDAGKWWLVSILADFLVGPTLELGEFHASITDRMLWSYQIKLTF